MFPFSCHQPGAHPPNLFRCLIATVTLKEALVVDNTQHVCMTPWLVCSRGSIFRYLSSFVFLIVTLYCALSLFIRTKKAKKNHFVKEKCMSPKKVAHRPDAGQQTRKVGGKDDRPTDGDSRTFKEPMDSSHSGRPDSTGKEVKWVEKTTTLHEAGTLISEKTDHVAQTVRKKQKRGNKTFSQCRRTSKNTWKKH